MFRIMNEYLSHISLAVDNDLYEEMKNWLSHDETYTKTSITVSFNRFILDLHMADYSMDAAEKAFQEFASRFGCSYSQLFVRYNEGTRIRYRFASCREDKTGVCMDVIYS